MRTATSLIGTRLTRMLDGTTPVASVYFDLRATAVSDALPRWRNVADRLARLGAPAATIQALATTVLGEVPGPGVLAAFTSGDEAMFSVVLAGAELADLARYGALPHLTPMLAWQQDHPAGVLAVLDRTGADISAYTAGSTDPLDLSVTGPNDQIERNAPGGWAQGRYQHRAEDSWEHNASAVAAVLDRILRRLGARILLLAGDVRALQYLEEHLPRRIHDYVTVRRLTDGPSADDSAMGRSEQVSAQTSRIVAEQLEIELDELANRLGTAVEGADATLAALAAGRVRVLLVPANQMEQSPAWFGPGPTDVATRPDALRQAGMPVYEAPLTDVAIRAALLTGAEISVVPAGLQHFSGGIAALCRFTP